MAVAVGPDHKIFFTDTNNHRIARIDDMTGKNWAMFGTHGTTDFQLSYPAGIALGAARTSPSDYLIYIADTGNSRVVKINNISGDQWLVMKLPDTETAWSAPHGVFIDDQQQIWVADTGNDRIVMLDGPLVQTYKKYGVHGAGDGQFKQPNDVAVDATGVTIADTGNRRVVHIDSIDTGANFKSISGKFAGPVAVAITK
jgi:DNA-binding beta-propeller fold protein YncE